MDQNKFYAAIINENITESIIINLKNGILAPIYLPFPFMFFSLVTTQIAALKGESKNCKNAS